MRAKKAKKGKREARKKKNRDNWPKDYVMKCIAKLRFENFVTVRNITDDESSWPDDWSEIDSEQERELEEYRAAFRTNTPDRDPQLQLEDPAHEVDDLTGYPAARGCKQCRKLQQPCSMIKDSSYPCGECVEEGNECQPIQEPAVKDRCKQCDQTNEEQCSFENGPAQQICDHCANKNYTCEAQLPNGYKASRINIDEIIWGPNRPYVACTACRKDKKLCSLKKKDDKPPCKYCAKNNLGCTFSHLPKLDTEKQPAKKKAPVKTTAPKASTLEIDIFTAQDLADMSRRSARVLERESTPEMEMEDGEGNKGMLTKIMTSFAHPIRFQAQDCEFCENPLFGITGHCEREVHVIRWHNGLGYAEVGGGHCQDTGETVMCRDCTNRRLQVLVCPRHQFEQLVDIAADHDALACDLFEAETGGAEMQYQLQRWCSVCFSPALYGCNTVQPDVTGDVEAQTTGCHLRLCIACEQTLHKEYQDDFDLMVTELDRKPKISEADVILAKETQGRLRADVGFLKQNGLLILTVDAMGE